MVKPKTTAPRHYLAHPELFGRPGNPVWTQPSSADEFAALRAAELQHQLAVAIFDAARERGVSIAWVEDRSAIAAGRLSKLLRGHAHMTLRDIQAVEGVLGPVMLDLRFQRSRIEDPDLRHRFDRDTQRWGRDTRDT